MAGQKLYLLVCVSALIMFGLVVGRAQQSLHPSFSAKLTEAPAGFKTPTLSKHPGSKSVSNGIPEPPKDTFAIDQANFEARDGNDNGLGPVYNATICADCHQNPVTGGPSQITEIRAGHLDTDGNFVNPTIFINYGKDMITGRSLINDRATCPQAEEHLPATENIRTLRAVLNTLGDGFVEAVDDQTLIDIAANQPKISNGKIAGETVEVPILEATNTTRVGRFGWKDQHGSVLSFSADAYLNEVGISNRLKPTDTTTVCKTTKDPEDQQDKTGLFAIDHFAQFIRGTLVPPRDPVLVKEPDVKAGEAIFAKVECSICHVPKMVTDPPGTVINGGTFTIPDALGNKIIHPFSDFLLHDVGTGDGIVQGGPQDTQHKLRTAALWGLRTKTRFMHDLKSESFEAAILRHQGEASDSTEQFKQLTSKERKQLLLFLSSL
jgi:CxxC motif-containing protein (DUF1111 family)